MNASKLAEKSSDSATSIDQATQKISGQSEDVMTAIKNGLAQLNSSQNELEAVALVLTRSAAGVADVNLGIDAIGAAIQEQQTASAQAFDNIDHLTAMARANAEAINEVLDSARDLAALATGLAATIGKFQWQPA